MDERLGDAAGHPDRENAPGDGANVSLLAVAAKLLRHRATVLVAALGTFVVVVAVTLPQARTYTSAAAFMPQSSDADASRLAGVAAQFGFSMPGGEAGESPEFYADLLTSNEILGTVVGSAFDTTAGDIQEIGDVGRVGGADLVSLFEIDKGSEAQDREVAMARLRRSLQVVVSRETGVVTLAVTTRWPSISQQIANRLIVLLNEFNLETRRTRAGAERQFVELRLEDVSSRLRTAEDALEAFLRSNRDISNAPELTFARDRLTRDVTLWQQVTTSVAQAVEQARIDEVRNTPLVTVVQRPTYPAVPDRRRLAFKGLLALLLGGMIGVFIILVRGFFEKSRVADPVAYADFQAARSELGASLRRFVPWSR